MYLHLLSDNSQEFFLNIARFVGMSDNPVLWDGKTEAELTGDTDLQKFSLKEVGQEKAILEQFGRECGKDPYPVGVSMATRRGMHDIAEQLDDVWMEFKSRLKALPLGKQNDPEERIKASSAILEKLYSEESGAEFSSVESKVMLHELFLFALADGEISSVEDALLRKFADLFQIEEFLYDDLLGRAQSVNREAVRALSIILE